MKSVWDLFVIPDFLRLSHSNHQHCFVLVLSGNAGGCNGGCRLELPIFAGKGVSAGWDFVKSVKSKIFRYFCYKGKQIRYWKAPIKFRGMTSCPALLLLYLCDACLSAMRL
jgi:hypothetical protein